MKNAKNNGLKGINYYFCTKKVNPKKLLAKNLAYLRIACVLENLKKFVQ